MSRRDQRPRDRARIGGNLFWSGTAECLPEGLGGFEPLNLSQASGFAGGR